MRKLWACLLLACVTAACGGDARPAGSPGDAEESFPATLQASNGPVTIPARPQRIVSLSPTATEMLFAIGAGSQVVAVDDNSNFPANAPKTALSGYEPNIEAIAGYRPDLVVYATETKGLGASLQRLGIVALQQDAAANLDDTYEQIEQLGMATGHRAEARSIVDKMRTQIRDTIASVKGSGEAPTYYHELDSLFFSATSNTFIGRIYALLGLRNIADPAEAQSNPYPQLSPEFIIQANPDLIFLADTKCCSQTAATVAARPGWNQISAVRSGRVVALDDDIASRWGPRIVDFLRTVAEAVRALKTAA